MHGGLLRRHGRHVFLPSPLDADDAARGPNLYAKRLALFPSGMVLLVIAIQSCEVPVFTVFFAENHYRSLFYRYRKYRKAFSTFQGMRPYHACSRISRRNIHRTRKSLCCVSSPRASLPTELRRAS